ncbi:hypothetical protein Fot_08076 [Forsythia ovata]|uniref:POLAR LOCALIZATION DURING ASYMMETRIC DIVISION AND protein n=1 Tax=Forsythia ovata TaxID=205694 RepID=A0ABD1WXL3_9LAMI
MWQVLLAAAAAAGSGFIAKKFINPNEPISDSKQNHPDPDQIHVSQSFNEYLHTQDSVFPSNAPVQENGNESQSEAVDDGGSIFRFSSHETKFKNLRKKMRGGFKKNGSGKMGRKCGSVEISEKGLSITQRKNWSGKRFSVCLKKRRTGKNAAGKCESCASKDGSFGWGVGVGIMYMMSSGKADISRLNSAMDETTKIVQELKAEISRRKASRHLHFPISHNEAETNKMHIDGRSRPLLTKSSIDSRDNVKAFVLTEEGEGASMALMEDQQPEVLEMDQLEAELESELQKLPWCATEGSGSEGRTDIFYSTIEFDKEHMILAEQAEVFAEEHLQTDYQNSNPIQFNGVLPSELDKKLSHLLIEQQKSEIVELETELHSTHSKLQEKETELQALKDCVKRLTEFSLASVSDDETNGQVEDEKTIYEEQEKTGLVLRKSIVGMKRAMDCESYNCCTK